MTTAMTTGSTDAFTAAAAPERDEQLLQAFRSHGDRAALGRLVERHNDQAYRLAARLAGNASDADDVLQEAVLALMGSAHQYRHTATGSVRSWYLAIVANTARRRARAARRGSHREQDVPVPVCAAPDPAPGQWDEEVRLAVGALPDHERLPILLRHADELAISDIAAVLGRKQKTVRSQIDRGLERLRAVLSVRCGLRSQAGIIAALGSACAPTRSPSPHLLTALQQSILTTAIPIAATGTGLVSILLGGVLLVALSVAATLRWPGTPAPVQAVQVPVPVARALVPAFPTPPLLGSGVGSSLHQYVPAVVVAIRPNAQGQQELVLLTIAQGVQVAEGVEFIVYRGNQYIVKMRAERVMQGMIACRVLPGSWNTSSMPIMPGDLAANRL